MKFNYTSPVTDILHTWVLNVLCASEDEIVVGEEERDEWED